jgi:hypothetical protein
LLHYLQMAPVAIELAQSFLPSLRFPNLLHSLRTSSGAASTIELSIVSQFEFL